MRLAFLIAAAIAAATATAPASSQDPQPLESQLTRAADYLDSYAKALAGVVLQEVYVQDVRYQFQLQPGGRRLPPAGPGHRQLKSDLLLIHSESAGGWRQFRDVFEVDGKPLRDRNDRLARLFLRPGPSAEAQARDLAMESARYNIGEITRDINLPLLTLLVIDRGNQQRFRFTEDRAGLRGLPRSAAFALQPGTLAVRYEEVQAGTLIRTAGDRDLPISGRLWLEPDTGAVLATELVAADRLVNARIQVGYQRDAGLHVLVPVEMHESYERLSDHMRIEGTATYSNFRRFQVQTDESIRP